MEKETVYPNTIIPATTVLEMTYRCNHRCLFCSVPWESTAGGYQILPELTTEEWKKCIDHLVNYGVKKIAFSGGEPLLKEGLADIIRYARSKKVKDPIFSKNGEIIRYDDKEFDLSLITNGELIDEGWISMFKEYHFIVNVSLPGINTFKELTGGGNYQRSLGAIRKLSDAGIDVVVSICVTRENLSELFETISLGFLHGAKQLLLNRFLPGGRGLNYVDLCLNKEEVIDMLDTAEEVCIAANTYGSVGTELPKCILKKDYKMIKVGTLCSGGVEFFAIDPSGEVRPCNHSPVRLGDFKDIPSAIETGYWQRFKTKDFLPKDCFGCALSLACDGGCREAAHIMNGNIDSQDPLFSTKCSVESNHDRSSEN